MGVLNMLNTMKIMFTLFMNDWKNLVVLALIMVSALIVFLGALKPFVFNKIKNKSLRGSILFFSSIALSFGAVAVAFWIKDWNFNYYWLASAGFSIWTIVIYQLYEYTRLRSLIEMVGKFFWNKIFAVATKEDVADLKKELNTVFDEVAKDTKKKVKTAHDKELDNV
jgi:hypothetical protein